MKKSAYFYDKKIIKYIFKTIKYDKENGCLTRNNNAYDAVKGKN